MALPSFDSTRIKHFNARWIGLASYLDSLDVDDEPDLDALSGVLTFNVRPATPLLFSGPQPFTLWPARRIVTLGDGTTSLALESTDSDTPNKAWRWEARFNVAYKGVPVSIPNAIFMAGDGDEIDLTSFIGRSGTASFFYENPVGSGMYAFYQGTMESDEYGIIPTSPNFVEDPPGSGMYRLEPT